MSSFLVSMFVGFVTLACISNMAAAFAAVTAPIANNLVVYERAKTSFPRSPAEERLASSHQKLSSTTALSMQGNLFDRFVRVFNANANKVVSRLEDPENVIIQAVDDMQVRRW